MEQHLAIKKEKSVTRKALLYLMLPHAQTGLGGKFWRGFDVRKESLTMLLIDTP